MNLPAFAKGFCLALATTSCFAATVPSGATAPGPCDALTESCSATPASAPDLYAIPAPRLAVAAHAAGRPLEETATRPFSALGIAVKVGVEGFGFDVATPLARKVNLRSGASFFSYSTTLTEEGINVSGTVTLRKASTMIDFFPTGGGFRLSAGVTAYNGNKLLANAMIAGGQTFTLNDQDYTSATFDPVRGTFNVLFGNKVAPVVSLGYGNIVPRKLGKHFTVPFEFGIEYLSTPTVQINLAGTACKVGQPIPLGCGNIATDPQTQANLQAQIKEYNSDLSPFRIFPVLSIGIGYKF